MVDIVEVGPRDGLQNESAIVSPADRAALIGRLVDAGLRRIEAVSFANPARVPQMAGAEEVMALVPRRSDVSYAGLVLNRKGLDRAVECGVDEINVVVVCSDEFSRRNQGVSREEMIDAAGEIVTRAKEQGRYTTVTLAASFGCPFEGDVPAGKVLKTAEAVLESRPDELALADTIGSGVPAQVRTLAAGVRSLDAEISLRFHFHNTRNAGYANALAAIELGVTTLDASIGGLGGCPFAPRATGNIATEDLAWQLGRGGQDTGEVSLSALLQVHDWVRSDLNLATRGLLAPAGAFPPVA